MDVAMVVGIQTYPRGQSLKGAVNDATEFYNWLIDPKPGGGNLNQADVMLLPSPAIGAGEPGLGDLLGAFEQFSRKITDQAKQGNRVRRCYLYFSGHGLANTSDSCAVLTAEGSYEELFRTLHLNPLYFVERYIRRSEVREIVLIMDCCRNLFPTMDLHKHGDTILNKTPVTANKMIAFATMSGEQARERDFVINGATVCRGVFTMALIEAFAKAEVDTSGDITVEAIRKYVRERLPELSADGNVQTAEILFPQDFVFVTPPPPIQQVIFRFPPPSPGGVVSAGGPANPGGTPGAGSPGKYIWLAPDATTVLKQFVGTGTKRIGYKEAGIYILRFPDGFEEILELPGSGQVKVDVDPMAHTLTVVP